MEQVTHFGFLEPQFFVTGAIFIASLRNGAGGHSKSDVLSIIVCLLGIFLWVVLDSPLLSIFANLAVAVIALIPTYIKARKAPETETRIAWLAGSISAFLATVSVGKLDYQLLLLPAASTLLQAYMVYILYFEAKDKSTATSLRAN